MKKKLIAVVLALTIILSGTIAFAAPSNKDLKRAQQVVFVTNIKIEVVVRVAQNTPWDDAAIAVAVTDRLAQETIDFLANEYGIVAVCEYTPYVIDGQTVLIDPIKIIEF